MSDSTSVLIAELADTRKALREAREALLAFRALHPKCVTVPTRDYRCPACKQADTAPSRPEGK